MQLGGFVQGQRVYLQTPSANTRGETVVTGSSSGVWGEWVSLGTMPNFAFEGVTVHLSCQTATTNTIAVDIATDFDGTSPKIIEGLCWSNSKSASESSGDCNYNIPVHVPAGVTLYARAQSSRASIVTTNIMVTGYAQGFGYPGFSRLQNLSTNALDAFISVAGQGGELYSWSSLGGSSQLGYRAFMLTEQYNTLIRSGSFNSHELAMGWGFLSAVYMQPLGSLFSFSDTDTPIKAKQMIFFPSSALFSSTDVFWLGLKSGGSETFKFSCYGLK